MVIRDRHWSRNFDTFLLGITLLLVVIGVVMIYSATIQSGGKKFYLTQMIYAGLSLGIMIIVVVIDYHYSSYFVYGVYAFLLMLLVAVLLFGTRISGAQRWIRFGSYGFQPSEFMKIGFILALSHYLKDRRYRLDRFSDLIVPLVLMGIPMVLIALQPNLGTSLVLLPVGLAMLYIAGVPLRNLAKIFLGILILSPFIWTMLEDYQRTRLLVFLDPSRDPLGAGYHITQSKIAIGAGQILGKGFLKGSQSQLHFLPEQHTDFIFSVLGEEWGLMGTTVVLFLFLLLLYRGIKIARAARDLEGILLSAGVIVLLSFHAVVNIGMATGIIPTVGVTLPFISYGGSSLLTMMIAVGILLNIRLRSYLF